jgi:hypothetical protein
MREKLFQAPVLARIAVFCAMPITDYATQTLRTFGALPD